MIKYLVVLALLVNGAYAQAAGGRPKGHPESITTQTSTLIAYHIQYGVQRDDSNYINSNNLNYVGKMASCPQVSIKENPYTYRATAKIDREDMTVKVEVNRSNCQIDKAAVKTYLDDAIKINQRKWLEQSEREQQTRAVDPKGPYKLGCEAYQQHIKGLSDVTSIDTAIKLYPKMTPTYVKNLFITGWNDASVYGARGVDCEYLSIGVRG
ncbi:MULTISPECIES: hypothetical protein [Aeromonas]|uniref:hypothetical protein n=1 Tax=Aeromonas TaxID=642 RepID=UPI000A800D23|nr:hypothetical protein [Aeromonas hydrophila]QPR87247.1 hypothetical protein I6G73_17500 [Aeromonas hydrophila]UON52351.1 hypothetical protein IUJ49_16650 [Aeromonas hydrophila]